MDSNGFEVIIHEENHDLCSIPTNASASTTIMREFIGWPHSDVRLIGDTLLIASIRHCIINVPQDNDTL